MNQERLYEDALQYADAAVGPVGSLIVVLMSVTIVILLIPIGVLWRDNRRLQKENKSMWQEQAEFVHSLIDLLNLLSTNQATFSEESKEQFKRLRRFIIHCFKLLAEHSNINLMFEDDIADEN